MFRIRLVPDDISAGNAAAIADVQAILRAQFPGLEEEDITSLPGKLKDPMKYRFRPLLLVAEDSRSRVRGFALTLHAPDLRFSYLDFIAVAPGRGGGGVGSAIYERVREESLALDAIALFFECLPDDPALCRDDEVRAQNAERLKFYERYGARPIANTAYETPLMPGDDNPPYLCCDALGRDQLPGRDATRTIVRAILERKYAGVCPPGYVDTVVDSFDDDPIVLRGLRYRQRPSAVKVAPLRVLEQRIALVVNDKHDIHHVRERGYVEAPVRIPAILRELDPTGHFTRLEPRRFPDQHILAVHDGRLVDYLRRACAVVGDGPSVYPYVFPIRNQTRPPKEFPLRAGYWCIDTFTPINRSAWLAARRAVDCALTAAERVLEGQHLAYALVRPPGHHAERAVFGGFCYFNNAAVAAHFLSRYGRVAVLDIDYHHGNGTQDIFYERSDVLTVSIHGHPSFAYPYFSGFAEETGQGRGAGFNFNLPLPEVQTPDQHRKALGDALRKIQRFGPDFLVLAAGFDTASGDPTGSWSNRRADFQRLGELIGAVGLPTVVVQEGGYRVRTLGSNVRAFFDGLVSAATAAGRRPPTPTRVDAGGTIEFEFRHNLRDSDRETVRALAAATGVFSSEEAAIASELIDERLARGEHSGYHFVIAERGDSLAGYVCYGPIAGAEGRYDLYWIVVHPRWQRDGLGKALLERAEQAISRAGGVRLYVDTANGKPYEAARNFYRRAGFKKVAEYPDFYSNGDAKLVFAKTDHRINRNPSEESSMKIGVTYDLRSDYLAQGYDELETAEFDRPDTVEAIHGALQRNGHAVERVGSVRQLAAQLCAGRRYDLVFNICEGLRGFGREAQVPALLDAYDIPYTFCDPLLASVSLHKAVAKRLLRAQGLPTADFAVVDRGEDIADVRLPLPLFAKPVAEGTSKGCEPASMIRHMDELRPACTQLLERYRQPVLVETYLPGREFTIGILGTGDDARAIGALEVVLLQDAEQGVYSYENKERCEELVDYRLAQDRLAREAQELGLAAWRVLGGRDAGRVDIRCDAQGKPCVLELNPIPGMHPEHSDLPMLCTRVGMSYDQLVRAIVESASARVLPQRQQRAA